MSETGVEPDEFEAARQRVLDAIDQRKVANFTGLPDNQRRLPAAFLYGLISGTRSGLCCALRIRGASITGPLHPPSSNQSVERVPLQFWDCHFDSPVDLSGAGFLLLRFVDCTLPAFIGASLRVSADLDLSGSRIAGIRDYESELSQVGHVAVHLNNARIGGKLDLSSTDRSRFSTECTVRLDGAHVDGNVIASGAKLNGCGDIAFSARAATIGGNVDLGPAAGFRCEVTGEVVLAAAQVTGDLICVSGRFINPDGRALHCEDLKVESVVLTMTDERWPFEAQGRLNFLTSVVGGSFFLSNARLLPGPDYAGLFVKGGPVALNLQQARISNALALNNVGAVENAEIPATLDDTMRPVAGWFMLAGIRVNALFDNVETGWPAHGFLDIDGAAYERIRHVGIDQKISRRMTWLRRQFPGGLPDAARFRPQPYEQLSHVLRQSGLAREANDVAVEKIRMRLAARVDSRWSRLFPRLLMLVSKHGYSTGRAMLSFLLFVMAGATMYATALFAFQQPFLPVESDPVRVTYTLAFGLAEHTAAQGCPGLDVFHYALDAALPVIDLAQDLRCRFTPAGSMRWLWLTLHSAYVIAGAALSAVVVLTLTGVLRQD